MLWAIDHLLGHHGYNGKCKSYIGDVAVLIIFTDKNNNTYTFSLQLHAKRLCVEAVYFTIITNINNRDLLRKWSLLSTILITP